MENWRPTPTGPTQTGHPPWSSTLHLPFISSMNPDYFRRSEMIDVSRNRRENPKRIGMSVEIFIRK